MLIFIVYGDCPVDRSGFHRFLVHSTNGIRSPGGSIFGIGAATCPLKACHRAIVSELRWRRRLRRAGHMADAARDLELWRATA